MKDEEVQKGLEQLGEAVTHAKQQSNKRQAANLQAIHDMVSEGRNTSKDRELKK